MSIMGAPAAIVVCLFGASSVMAEPVRPNVADYHSVSLTAAGGSSFDPAYYHPGGQSHYPFGHGPGFPFHGFPGHGAPPGRGSGHDCDPPVSP